MGRGSIPPWIRKKHMDGPRAKKSWDEDRPGGGQMGLFGDGPLQAIIDRIKDGHEKMWERWAVIRRMKEGTGKDKLLAGWDRARVTLNNLCEDLIKGGYTQCIYRDETLGHACLVCPVVCTQERCPLSYFNYDDEVFADMARHAASSEWEGWMCDGCKDRPWQPDRCPAWDIELLVDELVV